MAVPLQTLINNLEDSVLTEFLSSFSCAQDEDIENFLHSKAVEFETLSKARTYLVIDASDLEAGKEQPTIYGYISLALKILTVPQTASNRFRKELDGLSAKIHGQQIRDFPCYLIGQLSKNSNIRENPISGKNLLDTAFDIIASAAEAVGGRYMMIECRDREKLLQFYRRNGFTEIDRIPDEDIPMVQMIRKIQ